jgi:hypothetical protein
MHHVFSPNQDCPLPLSSIMIMTLWVFGRAVDNDAQVSLGIFGKELSKLESSGNTDDTACMSASFSRSGASHVRVNSGLPRKYEKSLSELQIPSADIQRLDQYAIGSGGSGTVYKVMYDNKVCASKVSC